MAKTKVKSYTRKNGTRVRGYAIYTKGRRTPILVDGNLSKKKAVKKALQIQKRGSQEVDKVRRLTEIEQKLADRGKWIKGYNIDKERKALRGVGPKPKGFEFSKSTSNKTNLELWEKVKVQAKAKMGGKHSARAMQLASKLYKDKGGGYCGKKPTSKSNALKKWTKEDWGYSSDKSQGKGKYLPDKAWKNLDSKEKDSLNKSKYKANKEGKQFSKAPKKLSKKVSKYWNGNSFSNQTFKTVDFRKANLVDAAIKVGAHRRAGKWVKGFKRTQQISKGDLQGLGQDLVTDGLISKGLVDSKKALQRYGDSNSDTIVGQFLGQGDLPSRKQASDIIAERVKKVRLKPTNPLDTIRKGFERERAFLDGISRLAGREVTKGELIRKGVGTTASKLTSTVKEAVSDPKAFLQSDTGENLIINTGGLIGGTVGGVAGPLGGVAGDLAGARVARRGLIDTKALVETYQNRHNIPNLSPEFGLNERVQRFGQLMDEAKNLAASRIEETRTSGLADDVGGWAAGNAVGVGLLGGAVPGAGVVPGVVGSLASQSVEKRMRETGEDLFTAAQQLIAQKVKSGDAREQALRDKTQEVWLKLLEG